MQKQNIFAILTPQNTEKTGCSAQPLPRHATGSNKSRNGSQRSQKSLNCSSSSECNEEFSDTFLPIILSFDIPLKDPLRGWQFGTSRELCDVLLGDRATNRLSSRQFNINIDEKGWIWLQDDDSLYGTAVCYTKPTGKKIGPRNKWLLSYGPGSLTLSKNITIHAGNRILQLEFPNHVFNQPEYKKNITLLFGKRKTTLLPSITNTSSSTTYLRRRHRDAMYVNLKPIGGGTFGQVYRAVNAQDGLLYAIKVFKELEGCTFKELLPMIAEEVEIMWDNCHPNVMRAVSYQSAPIPVLIMPYHLGGDLTRWIYGDRLNEYDIVSLLRQTLLGLRYLYDEGIFHYDLKPANILVKEELGKEQSALTFIITDFGCAKVSRQCDGLLDPTRGTNHYLAPELLNLLLPKYSHLLSNRYGSEAKVDIWAAGVTICECIWDIWDGAPRKPKSTGNKSSKYFNDLEKWYVAWIKSIDQKVKTQKKDDRIEDMIAHMLQRKPEARFSAEQLLELGCQHNLFRKNADGTIVNGDKCSYQQLENNDNVEKHGTETGAATQVYGLSQSPAGMRQLRQARRRQKMKSGTPKVNMNGPNQMKDYTRANDSNAKQCRAPEHRGKAATGAQGLDPAAARRLVRGKVPKGRTQLTVKRTEGFGNASAIKCNGRLVDPQANIPKSIRNALDSLSAGRDILVYIIDQLEAQNSRSSS